MRMIIEKAKNIYMEYQEERIKEGLDYNIFSMLDIERHEMKTHEYMIYAIMNLSQNRGLPVYFINLFLENMGLSKKFTKCEWSVEREYDINGGRIDLFLKSKGTEKLCVAVEMKIDADDQECQLKRYDEYCRRYSDYRVIYLTLDGKEATNKSVDGIEDKRKIVNVSFGEHIVKWIGDCIEACNRDNIDSSFIKQYEILVKKITKEDAMENKVKELIKGSENVKACLAIAETLESVKYDIKNEFFERLYNLLKKRCKVLDWNDEHVICQIRKIKVRGKEILICMQVEVDVNSLIYDITYRASDEDIKIIDSNIFKTKYKDINEKVENAISEAINMKITTNSYKGIKYFNLKNSENKIYDFKHFDCICAELADEAILEREVKYIAGNVLKYIKDIGKALDEALGDRIC